MDTYTRRFEVARVAAIKWMGRNGVTSDSYPYANLADYAEGLAHSLVAGSCGDRFGLVNGMRLVVGQSFDYVEGI